MYVSSSNQTQSDYNSSTKKKETSNNSFENELSKSNSSSDVEYKKSAQELVEDIFSLLRTGFTKDELEAIEKLKEEILKKINEEKENPSLDAIDKINDLIAKLEKMIQAMKKKVHGVAIEKAEDLDTSSNQNPTIEKSITALNELKEKMNELSKDIAQLEKLTKKNDLMTKTKEELFLMEQLRNS